jgi:hypothetical protein
MAAADYWSQAQLDPAYLAAHGQNRQSIINAILGYGSAGALSPQLAQQYGIGSGDIGAADQNPYSVQAQLAQTLSGNRYGITNNAAAHGAEFSGANVAAQAHELQNAGQRNYNAQQALTNQIAGIGAQDTSSLTGAYNTITTNQLNTPVAPPAVPDAVAPAAQAPAVLPTAAQIPGATPATQNWNDNPSGYNPQAPQNNPVAIKPPAPPKIKSPVGIHAQ